MKRKKTGHAPWLVGAKHVHEGAPRDKRVMETGCMSSPDAWHAKKAFNLPCGRRPFVLAPEPVSEWVVLVDGPLAGTRLVGLGPEQVMVKLWVSLVLVVFGAAFLFAAYQFATLAYAAPSTPGNQYHSSAGPTILEFAYGVPAGVFTVAGTAGILLGVIIASLTLYSDRPAQ